jgi:hypothetical protein
MRAEIHTWLESEILMMRQVSELSRQALEKIVQSVQGLLYLDRNAEGTEFWNPVKTWDGTYAGQLLAELLDKHGLVPDRAVPFELAIPHRAQRFVIYDYDADELAMPNVYHSQQAAAEDADMLNNTVVVALPIEPVKLSTDEE